MGAPQRTRFGPTPSILMQIVPTTVAEQLTLLNTDLFLSIHPSEYLNEDFPLLPLAATIPVASSANLKVCAALFSALF